MKEIGVFEAKAHLPRLVAQVSKGEITNTLLAGFRRKCISESKCTATFELLKSLLIAVEYNYAITDLDRLYRLGETYNLSSYDLAYLDLAVRLDLPLATRDKDLRSAAKSDSVKLFS